ncbi:TRAM domain-containing protein, partial [bacterium]|nr:TRAM domain-containing protein [bacterium]
ETEQDFQELCDFVTEFQFDRLGVFVYSREEGTYAYDLKKQVPEKIKKQRYNQLMDLQRTISLNRNMGKIDKTCRVLIDIKDGERYVGRTQYDAPEIDNEVIIETDRTLTIGDFVNVRVTDAAEYDLFAVPV